MYALLSAHIAVGSAFYDITDLPAGHREGENSVAPTNLSLAQCRQDLLAQRGPCQYAQGCGGSVGSVDGSANKKQAIYTRNFL